MIRYDLRRLLPRSAIMALCLVCLGAFHSPVIAQSGTVSRDAAFGRFMGNVTGAGQTTIGFGSNGTPVSSPSNSTLSTSGGTGVSVARTGSVYNPSGKPYNISATGTVPASKLAPIMVKAGKAIPILGTGVALYELFKEIGLNPVRNPDGSTTFGYQDVRTGTLTCNDAPGTKYYSASEGRIYALYYPPGSNIGPYAPGGWINSGTFCQSFMSPNGFWPRVHYITAPTMPAEQQLDDNEVADMIASKSGWPSSSWFARAAAQAMDTVEDQVLPETVKVTGPATSTGTTKTTNNSDGTKTVEATTYNHTYNNNTISTTTITTITNYNAANEPVSSSTKTETPEEKPDQCALDPQSIACARLDSPETEVPKTTKSLTYAPEDLGLGGGACPAPIPVNTSRGNWSLDLDSYCTATTTYVRPMVILVAMFLAYLIMTGHRFGGD